MFRSRRPRLPRLALLTLTTAAVVVPLSTAATPAETGSTTSAAAGVGSSAPTTQVLRSAAVEAEAGSTRRIIPQGCGTAPRKPDGTAWSCTFADHFSGSRLDGDNWMVGETSVSGYRVGATCFTDSRRNVAVRGGALRLTARDEGRPFTCQSPQGSFETRYTGGNITTNDHFDQTYGRFEVRAKYPGSQTPGLHGAFWMYPAEHTYGPWPSSGEIDVAEWWSSIPQHVVPSLHYSGRDWWADSGWGCTVADAGEYHTYAVEWTPEEMRFFIDGDRCFRRSWDPDSPLEAPQPFDHPFNVVLTMGVGQTSGTNAVTEDTELPAQYSVDYVKAWQ